MGFCILGVLGSCPKDTQKQINRQSSERDAFSDFISSTVNDLTKDIATTATNMLQIDVKGKYIDLEGWTINQSASVNQNIQMDISDTLTNVTFVKSVVDFLGQQAAQNKADDAGKSSMFDKATYQYTETEQSVLDRVGTRVTNTVNNSDMLSIVANASNVQYWSAGEEGGKTKILNFTFNQVARSIANDIVKAYYDSISTMVIPQSILDKLDQESDDIQTQSGSFEGMVEQLGIIVIVVLVIIIVISILYKLATTDRNGS